MKFISRKNIKYFVSVILIFVYSSFVIAYQNPLDANCLNSDSNFNYGYIMECASGRTPITDPFFQHFCIQETQKFFDNYWQCKNSIIDTARFGPFFSDSNNLKNYLDKIDQWFIIEEQKRLDNNEFDVHQYNSDSVFHLIVLKRDFDYGYCNQFKSLLKLDKNCTSPIGLGQKYYYYLKEAEKYFIEIGDENNCNSSNLFEIENQLIFINGWPYFDKFTTDFSEHSSESYNYFMNCEKACSEYGNTPNHSAINCLKSARDTLVAYSNKLVDSNLGKAEAFMEINVALAGLINNNNFYDSEKSWTNANAANSIQRVGEMKFQQNNNYDEYTTTLRTALYYWMNSGDTNAWANAFSNFRQNLLDKLIFNTSRMLMLIVTLVFMFSFILFRTIPNGLESILKRRKHLFTATVSFWMGLIFIFGLFSIIQTGEISINSINNLSQRMAQLYYFENGMSYGVTFIFAWLMVTLSLFFISISAFFDKHIKWLKLFSIWYFISTVSAVALLFTTLFLYINAQWLGMYLYYLISLLILCSIAILNFNDIKVFFTKLYKAKTLKKKKELILAEFKHKHTK